MKVTSLRSAALARSGRSNRRNMNVDFQLASDSTNGSQNESTSVDESDDETDTESNLVKTTDFGEVRKGTFGITINTNKKNPDTNKMESVEVYANKEEPFEYDYVNSLQNMLIYSGAKLTDEQIEFLGTALKSEDKETDDANGKAVQKLIKVFNNKLKADAKSAKYTSLVNKHKPLEGEDREVAIAKTIKQVVKLSGLPVETVIESLKTTKAVPADYTVEDYNSTKLRKTKGSDEDED